MTVTIPKGASLKIPEGVTINNHGTIIVQDGGSLSGEVTGKRPTYPSQVTVSFTDKDGNPLDDNLATFGSMINITATMEKKESQTRTLRASANQVDFYLEDGENKQKIGNFVMVTTDDDGNYTATTTVELKKPDEGATDIDWKPSESPYTITADFGGVAGTDDKDGLLSSTGSAQLTVDKGEQEAPIETNCDLSVTTSKVNSLEVAVTYLNGNQEPIELACVKGTDAAVPESGWTSLEDGNATFTNLDSGTPYTFFGRYPENDYYYASTALNLGYKYTLPTVKTTTLPAGYVGESYTV